MSIKTVLFSLNGRTNRQTFWVVMIPYVIIAIVFNGAVEELIRFEERTGEAPVWVWLVAMLFSISLIWVYIATVIKRLHDRDKSAKWFL